MKNLFFIPKMMPIFLLIIYILSLMNLLNSIFLFNFYFIMNFYENNYNKNNFIKIKELNKKILFLNEMFLL